MDIYIDNIFDSSLNYIILSHLNILYLIKPFRYEDNSSFIKIINFFNNLIFNDDISPLISDSSIFIPSSPIIYNSYINNDSDSDDN